jgi:hypothetical protein
MWRMKSIGMPMRKLRQFGLIQRVEIEK